MFSRPYATMIYVDDMDAAVKFYSEKIGLGVKFSEPGWSELDAGGHTLALHASSEAPVRHETSPHLILQVEDIERAVAELKGKDVEFVQQISPIEGCGFCATFVDPAGNAMGLYQSTMGAA